MVGAVSTLVLFFLQAKLPLAGLKNALLGPALFIMGLGAALGAGAVGGMLIGMICQIFIVPALFVVFQIIQEKIKPLKWNDLDNSEVISEIEQYSK